MDLFVSQSNHKIPLWFSRSRCDSATGDDAFNQSWTEWSIYAFLPRNLLLKTLLYIRAGNLEEAIMIVPYWPKRLWFPFLEFLLDKGCLFHPDLLNL